LSSMEDEEKFERWEADGLSPQMFLDAVRDDSEGFRLILRPANAKLRPLKIEFKQPLCYRGTHQPFLLREIYEGDPIYPWPIFIVRNSRYARWFYAQAPATVEKGGHHYHIAAMDELVDVLSALPPIISWLDGE
jgi:hypothetical protein